MVTTPLTHCMVTTSLTYCMVTTPPAADLQGIGGGRHHMGRHRKDSSSTSTTSFPPLCLVLPSFLFHSHSWGATQVPCASDQRGQHHMGRHRQDPYGGAHCPQPAGERAAAPHPLSGETAVSPLDLPTATPHSWVCLRCAPECGHRHDAWSPLSREGSDTGNGRREGHTAGSPRSGEWLRGGAHHGLAQERASGVPDHGATAPSVPCRAMGVATR